VRHIARQSLQLRAKRRQPEHFSQDFVRPDAGGLRRGERGQHLGPV
jgi:hypothetical protein